MTINHKLNELYVKLEDKEKEAEQIEIELDSLPDILDEDPRYHALMDSKYANWKEMQFIKQEIKLIQNESFTESDFTGATEGDR